MTPDEMAENLLRKAAVREVGELLDAVDHEEFTAWDVFAVLAILRAVKERTAMQQRPPAPVLALSRRHLINCVK
jgi:hypothetical protein